MGRPATKADLIAAATETFEKLNARITEMTEIELDTPFDFSGDAKKKEAHWKRDQNLRDVLIHLYEWHRLLLRWARSGKKGENEPFLPSPYNWRTYGALNEEFRAAHQDTSLEGARRMLQESHAEVVALAESFSEEELFLKGACPWFGGSVPGSYFVSVTSSHYNWALKKLNAHRKICIGKQGGTACIS